MFVTKKELERTELQISLLKAREEYYAGLLRGVIEYLGIEQKESTRITRVEFVKRKKK